LIFDRAVRAIGVQASEESWNRNRDRGAPHPERGRVVLHRGSA